MTGKVFNTTPTQLVHLFYKATCSGLKYGNSAAQFQVKRKKKAEKKSKETNDVYILEVSADLK